jgi:hypothetical protein
MTTLGQYQARGQSPVTQESGRLRPNPSVELTHSGTAPWPFGGFVYSPPHGQGAAPARSAHLQR